ncbi:hypothetical protein DDB_G0292158 [Dictyostelium discoideum AX4]|uniref:RWP-RK domain-containing protein n=1 Tax=Dictyostelium discoideum TaxID=44689 RepID=Q54DR5_DICDI|nr:hypothetical protein DDB_G0292158 [Dictyostelium discoideum AX4]EAL61435.1 hypothetical protein DDB_G0292158 [Dictyostelium discoideum AX4]|eukprot:XP_629807.1 hypothetical protein DDB_G0292158 [Dictyostelium discoideum AX4]
MTNIFENIFKIHPFSKNFHGEDLYIDGSYNFPTDICCKIEEQQFPKDNIFLEIKEEEKEEINNNLNYYFKSMEVRPSDKEFFNYDWFSFFNENSLNLSIIFNGKKKEKNEDGGDGSGGSVSVSVSVSDEDDENNKILLSKTVKKSKKSGKFKTINFTADIFKLKQNEAAKSLNISTSCINRLLKEEITRIPSLREIYFKPGKRRIIWPHRNCSKSPLVQYAIKNNGICIKYRKYKKGN